MPNLSLNIKVSLKDVFANWDDKCYLLVKPLSFSERLELSKRFSELQDDYQVEDIKRIENELCKLFVSGKGLSTEGKIVNITKDDFKQILPVVYTLVLNAYKGEGVDSENLPSSNA